MSDYVKRLEAVAEAAREAQISLSNTRTNIMIAEKYDPKWEGVADLLKPRVDALRDALAALDAHTEADADADAETVTLALWRGANGEVALDIAGSDDDVAYNTTWTRLGTVTLPLTPEGRP